MEDNKIIAWMESIDRRVTGIEKSISTMSHELGVLSGSVKPSMVPLLVKYVVFPLILVVGGVVGVKVFLPF